MLGSVAVFDEDYVASFVLVHLAALFVVYLLLFHNHFAVFCYCH